MGLAAVTLALSAAAAPAPLTAALEAAPPPPGLSGALRGLLDPRPLVVRAGGGPVLRLWFRAEIPVRPTSAEPRGGVTAGRIPPGALVGAVELPRVFTDYRGQRLPAGVYTLRFALQPDTGDHTGTAPHPEFFLFCPAAEDRSPAGLAPEKLIELSSRVNEGRHPAVLLLWPDEGAGETPRVVSRGEGVWTASVRRPARAGDRKTVVRFAVTVAGAWKP